MHYPFSEFTSASIYYLLERLLLYGLVVLICRYVVLETSNNGFAWYMQYFVAIELWCLRAPLRQIQETSGPATSSPGASCPSNLFLIRW